MNLTKESVSEISQKFNESFFVVLDQLELGKKGKSQILENWLREINDNFISELGESSEILIIQKKLVKELEDKMDNNSKIQIQQNEIL